MLETPPVNPISEVLPWRQWLNVVRTNINTLITNTGLITTSIATKVPKGYWCVGNGAANFLGSIQYYSGISAGVYSSVVNSGFGPIAVDGVSFSTIGGTIKCLIAGTYQITWAQTLDAGITTIGDWFGVGLMLNGAVLTDSNQCIKLTYGAVTNERVSVSGVYTITLAVNDVLEFCGANHSIGGRSANILKSQLSAVRVA
jgi:hypothetical protein